jgi:hypothetical protein
MVNFGYDSESKYWNEDKKHELTERLTDLVRTMKENKEISMTGACFGTEPYYEDGWGSAPHVEVDQMYAGVRIRKITHLSAREQKNLIESAEKIYREVMLGPKRESQVT